MENVGIVFKGNPLEISVDTDSITWGDVVGFLKKLQDLDNTKEPQMTSLMKLAAIMQEGMEKFTNVKEKLGSVDNLPVTQKDKIWAVIMRHLSPTVALDFTAGSHKLPQ